MAHVYSGKHKAIMYCMIILNLCACVCVCVCVCVCALGEQVATDLSDDDGTEL